MRHPTPVEIEDHLLKARIATVHAHLEECPDCARVARAIETLGDPLTWDITSLPDPEAIERFFPADEKRTRVLRGIGEAERLRHANPSEAVRICDETLRLAACEGDSEEARHLSVLVLRERANALRVRGDLPETHATIARARRIADGLRVSEYENAVLDYIEATALYDQEDLDRIENLARSAGDVLTRYGDAERALKVRFLSASVEYTRGNFERARSMYLEVLESIESGTNPPIEAGLLSNVANCEVPLGRHEDARRHVAESAELYARCGMSTEVTRVRWQGARIAAATGDFELAEERYKGTISEFTGEGLELDAALVSLELVEIYEREGRRVKVVEIATRLATIFAEAGTRMSLATTLATLRDTATRGEDVSVPLSEARARLEEMIAAS